MRTSYFYLWALYAFIYTYIFFSRDYNTYNINSVRPIGIRPAFERPRLELVYTPSPTPHCPTQSSPSHPCMEYGIPSIFSPSEKATSLYIFDCDIFEFGRRVDLAHRHIITMQIISILRSSGIPSVTDVPDMLWASYIFYLLMDMHHEKVEISGCVWFLSIFGTVFIGRISFFVFRSICNIIQVIFQGFHFTYWKVIFLYEPINFLEYQMLN